MSQGLSIYHGEFGRACLYHLDREMGVHVHRECHLVLHVAGRNPELTVSGRLHSVHPGTAVAINPWQPHNFQPTDLENGHLLLILYISPQWLVRHGVGMPRFGSPEIEINSLFFSRLHYIIEMMRRGVLTDHFDGRLLELIAECLNRSQNHHPPLPSPEPAPVDKRVCRSIELIRQSIKDGMNLDDVARNSGLSRSHFFKLFRQQTGVTPLLFRNMLLMEKGIDWLVRTERGATEVALDLGFSSQSSFSRFFTSNVGLSPIVYRRATYLVRTAGSSSSAGDTDDQT